MKKIFYSLLLLGATLGFTACDEDRDSNPTLQSPSTFVLNEPSYSQSVVDLANSETLNLTTSQPDYGFPARVFYRVQVSLTNEWTTSLAEAEADASGETVADYATLDEVYTNVHIAASTTMLNLAIAKLAQYGSVENLPETQDIYVRLQAYMEPAAITEQTTCYSNVVKLTTSPYYVELTAADPVIWYLTGSCIGDGGWGSDVPTGCFPMQPIADYLYDTTTGEGEIEWIGYLTTGGFKLRGATDDGWASQIGQGDAFGTWLVNDGGSANITVPEDGLYTVVLNTSNYNLSITAYEDAASVFDGISIAGSFNEWSDTEMSPVHTAVSENHDWYVTVDLSENDEIKFKQTGSWDYNAGGELVTLADGAYGYGSQNGPNIVVPESGTYLVIYNDITKYYRLILK